MLWMCLVKSHPSFEYLVTAPVSKHPKSGHKQRKLEFDNYRSSCTLPPIERPIATATILVAIMRMHAFVQRHEA